VSGSGPRTSRAAGWFARLSNTGAPPEEDAFTICAAEVTELIIQHGIEEAKACGAEFHKAAPTGDPQRDAQKSRRPVHMTRSQKRRYDAAFANLRLRACHSLLSRHTIGLLSASDLVPKYTYDLRVHDVVEPALQQHEVLANVLRTAGKWGAVHVHPFIIGGAGLMRKDTDRITETLGLGEAARQSLSIHSIHRTPRILEISRPYLPGRRSWKAPAVPLAALMAAGWRLCDRRWRRLECVGPQRRPGRQRSAPGAQAPPRTG